MELIGIRRHPVKAMAGESLSEATVDARGLTHDRWYAVADAEGSLATGKMSRRFCRHDEIFDYGARIVGPDQVEVYRHDGGAGPWRVGDSGLEEDLSARVGEPMRVVTEQTGTHDQHMDDSPVSLVGTASLAWFAEHRGFTVDDRRIRANLVVRTEVPFEEEAWTSVRVGAIDFDVVKRITRCRVVDLAQNHLTDTVPLLRTLGGDREAKLGIYLTPRSGGTLRLADPVHPGAAPSPVDSLG